MIYARSDDFLVYTFWQQRQSDNATAYITTTTTRECEKTTHRLDGRIYPEVSCKGYMAILLRKILELGA